MPGYIAGIYIIRNATDDNINYHLKINIFIHPVFH